MDERFARAQARPTEYRRSPSPADSRPDRFALWAVGMAVIAMIAGVASAQAASGGIGTSGDGSTSSENRYAKIWDGYSAKNKRWARRTSECESGGDPKAIGGGGLYRGAFQFMRSTWKSAPKSPGGDPIRYRWKTQAVVAVALKREDGAGHWPNCG